MQALCAAWILTVMPVRWRLRWSDRQVRLLISCPQNMILCVFHMQKRHHAGIDLSLATADPDSDIEAWICTTFTLRSASK